MLAYEASSVNWYIIFTPLLLVCENSINIRTMRDLASKMSDMAMVSLIRDTSTIIYAGVVMRKRSTFCQRDMKVTLNKKNKLGLIISSHNLPESVS